MMLSAAMIAALACAQDGLSDLLERLAHAMDDAVLQIHKAARKGPEKPIEHLDRALEDQREVLQVLDELLKDLENAPG